MFPGWIYWYRGGPAIVCLLSMQSRQIEGYILENGGMGSHTDVMPQHPGDRRLSFIFSPLFLIFQSNTTKLNLSHVLGKRKTSAIIWR